MRHKQIEIAEIPVANNQPLVLFGGLNVLESRELTLSVAEQFAGVCSELSIPLVFKASFDKSNRSSVGSFRGPGIEKLKSGTDCLLSPISMSQIRRR